MSPSRHSHRTFLPTWVGYLHYLICAPAAGHGISKRRARGRANRGFLRHRQRRQALPIQAALLPRDSPNREAQLCRRHGMRAEEHKLTEPAPLSATQLAQLEGRTALKAPVRALFIIRSWSWDSVTETPEDPRAASHSFLFDSAHSLIRRIRRTDCPGRCLQWQNSRNRHSDNPIPLPIAPRKSPSEPRETVLPRPTTHHRAS